MKKFMNLSEEYNKEDSRFYILPIEYEHNVTYGKGASKGPEEIIKASEHLEYYDDQFENEPFAEGIHTLQPLTPKEPEEMVKAVSKTIEKNKSKFIISLGGDHAVTIGCIEGLDEDFSVITLDAHPDFFGSWNGSKYNHRCTAKHAAQKHKTLIVGTRSMDVDEIKQIEVDENADMIKAYDYDEDELLEKLDKLNNKVYISIDVDVFDPSFIRNTGTPEPGGFTWNQVINLLKIIFKEKEVIGADIVEFSPNKNFEAESYSLAKLAHKIMSLKMKFD